jgi:hypothetical protein
MTSRSDRVERRAIQRAIVRQAMKDAKVAQRKERQEKNEKYGKKKKS